THLSAVAGLAACGQAVWDRVPAALEADRQNFTVAFCPRTAGLYALHFEDETGLANSRLFELRLRADPAPTVELERPSPSRDVLSVLPVAELALHVVAEDPYYAVRTVWLEHRTGREGPAVKEVLYEQDRVIRGRAGALFGGATAVVPWRLRPVR